MPRQRRILLHPGFHRTGTASVAAFLDANRADLAPHLGLLLPPDLTAATDLTRRFSADLNPLRLADLVETMDDILAAHGLHPILNDTRDMVISAPDLGGLMPGAPGVTSYGAVPIATAYLAGYLTERFPRAEVVVVFTTRGPRDWLQSVWRASLAAQRLKQDWTTFSAALARAANLDHAILNAAHAIDPVAAYTLPLHEAALHPQGPGGALLELIDLPAPLRAALRPVPATGRGPSPDLAATLLELNLSDLPKKLLAEEKQLLTQAERTRAPDAAAPAPAVPRAAGG